MHMNADKKGLGEGQRNKNLLHHAISQSQQVDGSILGDNCNDHKPRKRAKKRKDHLSKDGQGKEVKEEETDEMYTNKKRKERAGDMESGMCATEEAVGKRKRRRKRGSREGVYEEAQLYTMRKIEGESAFGFSLQPGAHDSNFFIKDINQGSPAWRANMRCYDIVREINGIPIRGFSNTQVCKLMSKYSDVVTLLAINRRCAHVYTGEALELENLVSALVRTVADLEESRSSQADVSVEFISQRVIADILDRVGKEAQPVYAPAAVGGGGGESAHCQAESAAAAGAGHSPGEEVGECVLVKTRKSSKYGFRMKLACMEPGDIHYYIEHVEPGSPSELRLFPGDRLLAINGVSVEGKESGAVLQMIGACSYCMSLTVLYNPEERGRERPHPAALPEGTAPPSDTACPRPVKLCRIRIRARKRAAAAAAAATSTDGAKFGFRVVVIPRGPQHEEWQLQVNHVTYMISEVRHDSPADRAGVRVGDLLLEVNGVAMCKTSLTELLERIGGRRHEVTLLLASRETLWYYEERGVQVTGRTCARGGDLVLMEEMGNWAQNNVPTNDTTAAPPHTDDNITSKSGTGIRLIHLHRSLCGSTFGFNFVMKLSSSGYEHVITKTTAVCADLKLHDRIIEVNGKPTKHLTNFEVSSLIRGTADTLELLVDSNPASHTTTTTMTTHNQDVSHASTSSGEIEHPIQMEEPYLCCIKSSGARGTGRFGVELNKGENIGYRFIKAFDRKSPVAAKLCKKPIVLQINGVPVKGLAIDALNDLMRDSGDELKLLLLDRKSYWSYKKQEPDLERVMSYLLDSVVLQLTSSTKCAAVIDAVKWHRLRRNERSATTNKKQNEMKEQ